MKKNIHFILSVVMSVLCFGTISLDAADFYVNCTEGNNQWDGKAAFWDEVHGPKATVQAGLDAAGDGDVVILASGTYSGSGNRDLDFQGKALTLRSTDPCDPAIVAATIIDSCGTASEPHRGFYFHTQEDANSIVHGLTINGGFAWGGGFYCYYSSPSILNCIISDNNTASSGGGIFCDHADPIIRNCTIRNNSADSSGGGIYCYSSSPVINDCIISSNTASSGGGLYCSMSSSPELVGCTISDNFVLGADPGFPYKGGGICAENNCDPIFVSCMVNGNFASNFGGGIYLDSSTLGIVNSVLTGNICGKYGGAIYNSDSTASLTNCTLSANEAVLRGGGIRLFSNSTATVTNCILWDNLVAQESDGPEIALVEDSTMTISYSNVEGGLENIRREDTCVVDWVVDDNGNETNIDQNPYFSEDGYWDDNGTAEDTSDDFWLDGDYSLLTNSPCLNSGNNNVMSAYNTDIEGNNRIYNDIIDMGAYECAHRIISIDMFMAFPGGLDRENPSDFFMTMGRFDALEQEFASAETLNFGLWHEGNLVFDANPVALAPESIMYGRLFHVGGNSGDPGNINLMLLDLNRGTFLIFANQVNLSGLSSPLTMTMTAGQYEGIANTDEDIINGPYLPLSMKFLSGQTNALRVDRPLFRPQGNFLMLMGSISVDQLNADIAGSEVTMQWGGFEFQIPSGSDGLRRYGNMYMFNKPFDTPSSAVYPNYAMFDLKNCTFMLFMLGSDIPSQPNPVDFTMSFDYGDSTFDQSVSVDW
ncbi:MAG: hypothetical protein KAJ52_02570 [Sedimentisphaerales bacterium]|nr:hypothetical protein [Sedimentisphaerales bacterium]